MSAPPPRRVLSVVPDLFFAARIRETAKSLGVTLEESDAARAVAACEARSPDLVILDLAAAGDPLAVARALRASAATREIPIAAFYPHVDEGLRLAAIAAGVDPVLPRSAFTVRLAALLAGSAERARPGGRGD